MIWLRNITLQSLRKWILAYKRKNTFWDTSKMADAKKMTIIKGEMWIQGRSQRGEPGEQRFPISKVKIFDCDSN